MLTMSAGSDAAVVRRTQARLGARQQSTVHYGAYFTVKSYYTFLLFAVFGKMMEVLAQYAWGRTLLLQFPGFFSFGIFSRAGPTQRQMDETKFQMDFFGDGYSQGVGLAYTLRDALTMHLFAAEAAFCCVSCEYVDGCVLPDAVLCSRQAGDVCVRSVVALQAAHHQPVKHQTSRCIVVSEDPSLGTSLHQFCWFILH